MNFLWTILSTLALGALSLHAFPIGPQAWGAKEWREACGEVRTSFNPDRPLSDETLSLTPADERFLDFLYWAWANKIAEHQIEQVGGTEWEGPQDGVIFHWAPGSRWEMHTLAPFDAAIHHITMDHKWTDRMFPDFFEAYGGSRGVNIGERLSLDRPPTWASFLEYIGGPESPHYRYVFHQESGIDPRSQVVTTVGGQGVAFQYTFEQYLEELKHVLTDCRAFQFFEMYDRYGKGFASRPGWGGQVLPGNASEAYTAVGRPQRFRWELVVAGFALGLLVGMGVARWRRVGHRP